MCADYGCRTSKVNSCLPGDIRLICVNSRRKTTAVTRHKMTICRTKTLTSDGDVPSESHLDLPRAFAVRTYANSHSIGPCGSHW